ncbi:MAG: hypothetical protein WC485_02710, partial [Opitutaceae bacterium]
MNTRLPAHCACRIYLPLAAAMLALPALDVPVTAQSTSEPVPLDVIMVTATRTPTPLSALGSSVDFISGEELARQQLGSLREALGDTAGMPLFASGASGAAT